MRNVKVIGVKGVLLDFIKIFEILEVRDIDFNMPSLNIGCNIVEFIYSDDDSDPDELISVRKLEYIDNDEDVYVFDERLTAKEFLNKKLYVDEVEKMTQKTSVSEELFEAVEQTKTILDDIPFKFSALAHDNVEDLTRLYQVFHEHEVESGHTFSLEDEELLIKYLLFDGENPFSLNKPNKFVLEAKDEDNDRYWFKKDFYGRSTFTEDIDQALEFNSRDEAEEFKAGGYYIKQV